MLKTTALFTEPRAICFSLFQGVLQNGQRLKMEKEKGTEFYPKCWETNTRFLSCQTRLNSLRGDHTFRWVPIRISGIGSHSFPFCSCFREALWVGIISKLHQRSFINFYLWDIYSVFYNKAFCFFMQCHLLFKGFSSRLSPLILIIVHKVDGIGIIISNSQLRNRPRMMEWHSQDNKP